MVVSLEKIRRSHVLNKESWHLLQGLSSPHAQVLVLKNLGDHRKSIDRRCPSMRLKGLFIGFA